MTDHEHNVLCGASGSEHYDCLVNEPVCPNCGSDSRVFVGVTCKDHEHPWHSARIKGPGPQTGQGFRSAHNDDSVKLVTVTLDEKNSEYVRFMYPDYEQNAVNDLVSADRGKYEEGLNE